MSKKKNETAPEEEVKQEVIALKEKGVNVGLAVIIVGDDPASRVYVNNKKKAGGECMGKLSALEPKRVFELFEEIKDKVDYIVIDFHAEATSEKEAFIICNDILNKMKNGYCVFDKNLLEKGENPYRKPQYKDFAILIDKTKDFDLYKKIFEYFNIPLTIYRDESLLEGYNIILICNILKFINKIYLNEFDETFKYLYVSIARSFLFNNYDDEIYLNIKYMNIYQSEIFNISKAIANNIKNLSFKEIISLVINDFSFYEKIHLVGSIDKFIAEVEYLITLAIVINKCNNSFGDFIGFIDDIMKYDLSLTYSYQIGMQDGVKLMTVHKSKGLEFPVIYCSGLGSKFNESEIKSSFLFNQEMGIICPNYQFGIKDTFLKSNYIYNYKYNEISERIRLFYVMLTRAKEKIIFVIDNIENKDSNLPDNLKKFKINSFKKMINLSLDNVVYDLKNLSDNDIEVSDKYKVISKVNFDKLKKENFEIRCNDNVIKYEKIVKQRLSKDSLNIDNVHVKMMKRKGTELHYIFEQLDILNLYNDIDSINKLNYSLNIKKLINT